MNPMRSLQRICHDIAKEKGFWDGQEKDYNVSEKLMLIVSELGEACEALRNGKTFIKQKEKCVVGTGNPLRKLSDEEYMGIYLDYKRGKKVKKLATQYKVSESCIKKVIKQRDDFYNSFEMELADAIIRILDLAEKMDIDMDWQIFNKLDYNKKREYKHGKKF